MKVNQLKRLAKLLQNKKLIDLYEKDGYIQMEDFFSLKDEDIDCLEEYVKNDQIEDFKKVAILALHLCATRHLEWQEAFERIQIDDYKHVVSDKILKVKDVQESLNVLKLFEFCGAFDTKEEYMTYLNYLDFANCDFDIFYYPIDDLTICLKERRENRTEIIQNIMEYYYYDNANVVPIVEFKNEVKRMRDEALIRFLRLINKDFDMLASSDLVLEWQEDSCFSELSKHAMEYIEGSSVDACLPALFLKFSSSQYEELIQALKWMEVYYPDVVSSYSFNDYALSSSQNTLLFESLKALNVTEKNPVLNQLVGNFFDENIISHILNAELDMEEKKERLSQLLKKLQEMSGCPTSVSTSSFIKSNYNNCVCVGLFDALDTSTYDNFDKLAMISFEWHALLGRLIDLKSFQKDVHDGIIDISLLTNSENTASFNYLYAFYEHKGCSLDSSKKESLLTVSSALRQGYDIDMIFKYFDEDEEITPKTLVRNIKFVPHSK